MDDFPRMYQAINKLVKKESLHHFHDGTAVERQGFGQSLDLLTAQ